METLIQVGLFVTWLLGAFWSGVLWADNKIGEGTLVFAASLTALGAISLINGWV